MSSQIGDLIEGVLILGSRDINLAGPWIPVYWIDLSGGTMEPGPVHESPKFLSS